MMEHKNRARSSSQSAEVTGNFLRPAKTLRELLNSDRELSLNTLTREELLLIPGFHADTGCDAPWAEKDLQPNGKLSKEELAGRRLYNKLWADDAKRKQQNHQRYIKNVALRRTSSVPAIKKYITHYEAKTISDPKTVYEISHYPFACPECLDAISPSTIMKHFTACHTETGAVKFVEIYEQHRHLELLVPTEMKFHQNKVISLFAFGGRKQQPGTMYISRKLATGNAPLYGRYARFSKFTPVMFIACLTTWSHILKMDELTANDSKIEKQTDVVLVLWMATAQLVKPLYAIISVFDRSMNESLSHSMRVRNTSQTQNCADFVNKDNNYLLLRHDDIKAMTQNFKHRLRIEVLIDELCHKPAESNSSNNNNQKKA